MKTIATLKGPDFLRACNRTRHAVAEYIKKTDVNAMIRRQPSIPDGCTPEDRQELLQEQSKRNISAAFDRMLDDFPQETYDLILSMCVIDPGEDPDGIDIMTAGMELVSDPRIVDFFTKLVRLAQTLMDA